MKSNSLSVKKYFFSLLLLANVSLLLAQNSDWGLWTNFDLTKGLSEKWDFGIDVESRLKNKLSATDQIRGGLSLTRSLGENFNLGAGYQMIAKYRKEAYNYRHRYYLQTRGQYKYERFTADWRIRMHLTLLGNSNDDIGTFDRENTNWVLRNRFRLRYNIKGSSFRPYAYYEMFHRLFSDAKNSHYQNRLSIGTVYRLNKNHDVNVGYMFETEVDGTKKNKRNIIQVGFSYSF